MIHLLSTLSLLITDFSSDPWVGPNDSSRPDTTLKVTPYSWTNTTGHPMDIGMTSNPYSAPYILTRTVSDNRSRYNGWGEPDWTIPFQSIGDFSVTYYATQSTSNIQTVPDGSTYIHDVYKLHKESAESFDGGTVNPGHTAARSRVWETFDHEDRHVVSF